MFQIPLAAFAIVLLATPSLATVLDGQIVRQNGNGGFVKLETDIPFSVGFDTFDDDNLYAFDEDQNIALTDAIRVDIGGENGVIPSGTTVASHYVFFDSLAGVHIGTVLFDAPVLGIAAYRDTMKATDFLANTKVNYISEELRGLEQGDYVWVDDNNPNQLWVYWAGSSPGDYIRVFTAQSPAALLF